MKRKQLLAAVIKRLGKRNLFWQGIRSIDASILFQIPQFSGIFSITVPLNDKGSKVSEVCLEELQKRRVNIRQYDVDKDDSEEARELHHLLFAALKKPAVVLTYKPNIFSASACFPQSDHIEHLGLFCEHQAAFENKIWVESELKKYGIRTVPWSYFGQHNRPDYSLILKTGRFVLRNSSSGPGGGDSELLIASEQMDIPLHRRDALYALSPYLGPNVPLNINACVFQDGTVTLHGPSVQLIGIPSCTGLPLAYCGNDFAQVRNLDSNTLNELETLTLQAGKWLASKGYLGAFGLDAIEYQNHVYFNEINPRLQGSSIISARLDEELGRPDVFLNHIASFFGMPAPPYMPLRDLAKQQSEMSQIFYYNRRLRPVIRNSDMVDKQKGMEFKHLPAPDVEVVPEGMLFKTLVPGRVTDDGHSILKKYENRISEMDRIFSPKN
jgi:hypothetical protein